MIPLEKFQIEELNAAKEILCLLNWQLRHDEPIVKDRYLVRLQTFEKQFGGLGTP